MFEESLAIWKRAKKGKCKESPFVNGMHRTGLFETECLLDGGAAGNSCKEICLHCGKIFKQGWFVIRNQPNKVKGVDNNA